MLPVSVSRPLVLPEQIVVPPVTLPPTVFGSTVTVVLTEFASLHTPLLTTVRNMVVATRLPEMYVEVVAPEISVHELNGSDELCHFTTAPVLPESVSKPLGLSKQTVVPPVTVPATVAGSTVTFTEPEVAGLQTPL